MASGVIETSRGSEAYGVGGAWGLAVDAKGSGLQVTEYEILRVATVEKRSVSSEQTKSIEK